MKGQNTPPPPDPVATAQAQTQMNRDTAIAQTNMNMVDQITPDGALKYTQSGWNTDGTPKWTATTSLSDSQQKTYDINQQTENNIATIGRDQSQRIGTLLSQPINLNNEATEGRLMELGSKRLDPRFAREEDTLRTRLANSGIREGSAAWKAEMDQFQQGRNDAVNQLLLTGRGQAVQEALTERNQPINEITALMGGSQVSMPQFTNTPQSQVAGVDYAGMVQNNYNNQLQAAKMKQDSKNAMMGGLFSLAGTVGRAFVPTPSDRRLKTDIQRVGTLDNGLSVYSYRYKDGGPVHIGLMADEVRTVRPEAVVTMPDGFDAVFYAKAVLA